MKSAESADCPGTFSTPALWPSFITLRPGVHSLIGFSLTRRPNIVEMESVFALKARTGEIDQQAVLIARRRLEADLGSSRLLVAAVNDGHLRGARQLLIKHGTAETLRTLDALQLSVALSLKRAGLAIVFVAADQKLCRLAALEGFAVTNPEQPPTVTI